VVWNNEFDALISRLGKSSGSEKISADQRSKRIAIGLPPVSHGNDPRHRSHFSVVDHDYRSCGSALSSHDLVFTQIKP
jgi:hypothetical protein